MFLRGVADFAYKSHICLFVRLCLGAGIKTQMDREEIFSLLETRYLSNQSRFYTSDLRRVISPQQQSINYNKSSNLFQNLSYRVFLDDTYDGYTTTM